MIIFIQPSQLRPVISIVLLLSVYVVANESVGKVLLTSESDVFGDHLTLPKHEIVDCSAFYEVTFFCISPKNLLGDFFYSLNAKAKGRGGFMPHPS
jgi:hypothetical protein